MQLSIAGLGFLTSTPCLLADGFSGLGMHTVCPRLACRARYLPRIWRKCTCEAILGVMWRAAGAVGERSSRP